MGKQGAAGGRTGFHGVAFGAVIFVKRDHGGGQKTATALQ